MPLNHTVVPGEGFTSIASMYGFHPETLWNHPENAALKQDRKNPEMLLPGDVVHVPDLKLKHQEIPTDTENQFVRKGIPAKLNLKLMDHNGEPRANTPYDLSQDGKIISGTTDAEGWVRQPVAPDTKKAVLHLKDGAEKIPLKMSNLAPLTSPLGAQTRLQNLGFLKGPAESAMHPHALDAVTKFQKTHGIPPTGKLDPATLKKLEDVHGS